MTSAWEPPLTSVTKRRSYDARFYKPVCLIAVIDAVSDGAVAVTAVSYIYRLGDGLAGQPPRSGK
jgi:hypothetical protein